MEDTTISAVMTPNPEFVSPDMTVLEALQTMHENKFLTLPVCEDGGSVVGLVNVMDLIYGCGGTEGWRSVFSTSLDLDDLSETASYQSVGVASKTVGSRSSSVKGNLKDIRSVSKLRPKKPLVCSACDTVLSVTQMLASKRGDASLIVSEEGGLVGIVTDTDITRRLVAKQLDASSTRVSNVMTPNPTCVSMSDSAMDAMTMMVDNHFRHLPVLDDEGGVVGLLDIAKCLNDAISKLEKSESKSRSASEEALNQAMESQGAQGAQATALKALLGPLMNQAFGNQASPTLRSLLVGKPSTVVNLGTSVLEAGIKMAESRKAALVVEEVSSVRTNLVGIFGFKDMMIRVVAKELPMEDTTISAVMTPNPEFVSPDMTVLEALQTMYDENVLTLPVCEDDGSVSGCVDVIDLILAFGKSENWWSIFESILRAGSTIESSATISVGASVAKSLCGAIKVSRDSPIVLSSHHIPRTVPSTLEFQEGVNDEFDETTLNDTCRMESGSFFSDGNNVLFKIVDPDGHTHRLYSVTKILCLRELFDEKLAGRMNGKLLSLKFYDEEGDAILISTDDDLVEAVALARRSNEGRNDGRGCDRVGSKLVVKLFAEEDKRSSNGLDTMLVVGIGVTIAAMFSLGAMILKPKTKAAHY
jgi:CBS domain-containing protein